MKKTFLLLIASLILVSCGGGGGGGDTSTPSPVTSFALQAGYKAYVAASHRDNFNVSGTCNGTATVTSSIPTAATFEGIAGYSTTSTVTLNVTNCTPATSSVTGTDYYDANYNSVGASTGGEYSVALTVLPLPTSVKVGDTAVYAAATTYSDSTKTTVTGRRELSYIVENDSSTTAFVTAINKRYNTSNQLLSTSQEKYRIAGDGTLTLLSTDVQLSTTSTTHLLYTKI